MFHSDSRNSSYVKKSVFSEESVLVKAKTLDSKATDPKLQTVLETHTPTDLCSKFQLSRYYTG
jgi:hypothetical protein